MDIESLPTMGRPTGETRGSAAGKLQMTRSLSVADLSRLLSAFGSVDAMPPRLLEAIRRDSICLAAPKGETLFDGAHPIPGLLLLVSGRVAVFNVSSSSGRCIALYRVHAGETCAISICCLMGRVTLPLRAVADEAVEGVILPRGLFYLLVSESQGFLDYVARVLAERTGYLLEMIEDLAFARIDHRLAKRLLQSDAPLAMTHQALADELGSGREVISRALKHFESDGLVRLHRGRIEVADREGLEAVMAVL